MLEPCADLLAEARHLALAVRRFTQVIDLTGAADADDTFARARIQQSGALTND